MAEDDDGTSPVELFVLILILADIPIIALAVIAGPLYAVALAAVVLVGSLLAWWLTQRFRTGRSETAPAVGEEADASDADPVTELQRRYAAGELSESEFERKLDRLVESERRADEADVDTEGLSLERSE